jgi:carbonic anhydrase
MTLTKEMRDSLTPAKAVRLLKDGNKRFVNNLNIDRNLLKQINETSEEQNPFAFILSCIDSRTSAELIFDQGLGDIFSCRIAGNVLNDDIIGSMEFACRVAGVKTVMVLGHTECGAIKGACDHVKMGKLTGLLNKIKPAVSAEKTTTTNRDSKNYPFVQNVASINVRMVMKQVARKSKIIESMLRKREIALIGGMYDVSTGIVEFY